MYGKGGFNSFVCNRLLLSSEAKPNSLRDSITEMTPKQSQRSGLSFYHV